MQERHDTFQEEGELNLLELMQVLVARRRLVFRSCAAAALLSAGVSLVLPTCYSATATVLPPQKDGSSGLSALLGQAGGLASLASGIGFSGNSDLYLGILKSRSVADAVIRRMDLARVFDTDNPDQTRKKLKDAVKVQAGKDGIISVTADGKTPRMAAELANCMVDELAKRSVQLNLSKAGTERAFLERRLDLVKQDLKRAEEELRQFQEANRSVKVDTQATATIEGIARLRAEIVSREVQLASLKSFQTEESPEVKAQEIAISRLKSQMGGMEGRGGSDVIPSVGNVPGLGLQYVRKMRELKVQEAIFEQLTKQYEMAKLNEAKDSSSLQILDDAVPPVKKSKPARALIVVLATFSALLASVFAAFVLEYLERMPAEDRERLAEMKRSLFPLRRSA